MVDAERALLLLVHLLNAVNVLVALVHAPHLIVNGPRRLGVLDVAGGLLADPETRRILFEGAWDVLEVRATAHSLQLLLDVHCIHTLRPPCLRGRGFSQFNCWTRCCGCILK